MGDTEGGDGSTDVGREGVGKQISQVEDTREERNQELTLTDPVADPVKAHVYALGLLGPNGVGRKSDSTFAVT